MTGSSRQPEPYVGSNHVGDEAICVDGVSYRYPRGPLALEDIHLHVTRGSTLAVVGPNGAGKTTLLKIVLGLIDGYTGSVRVLGMRPDEARRKGIIGWVPQQLDLDWSFPVSVRQVVHMGLIGKTGAFRRPKRGDLDHVARVMDVLKVNNLADRPIGDLSGGQRQRVIISRSLAARPAILILDEPTVGVDEPGQALFRSLLDDIRSEFELTPVIVSHDLRTVLASCQRIACLNRRLHFHDAPEHLTDEMLSHVFQWTIDGLHSAVQRVAAPVSGFDGAPVQQTASAPADDTD